MPRTPRAQRPHVDLALHPEDIPKSWLAFCASTPPFSVALDGYVHEPPQYDAAAPRANFNHHQGVDRFATRATCAQVLLAIRMGLFERFRTAEGVPKLTAYANDCDEDVCLSWFLLAHPEFCANVVNPKLNRLVHTVDLLDTTAGLYPFPRTMPLLEEHAWIFQPYREFRMQGLIDVKTVAGYRAVIDAVCHRIDQSVRGHGKRLPLDTRYERIGGGPGWALIEEHGLHARYQMVADGIRAFISVRRKSTGGWMVVVGRTSIYVPFPVPAILAHFDALDRINGNTWGGGDTIGGTAHATGTKLAPPILEREVNALLASRA